MAAITSGNVGKSLCIGLSWTEIRITKLFWFESPFMWIWRRTVYNLILFLLSSFPPILSGLLGLKCIYRKSIYNTQRNIVLAWESISFLNCFKNAILYNFYTFFLQMQLKLFPELKHVSKERPPLCSSLLLNRVGSFWWKCLFKPRLIWKPSKWNYFWLVLQRRSKVMKVQRGRSTHSTHLPTLLMLMHCNCPPFY